MVPLQGELVTASHKDPDGWDSSENSGSHRTLRAEPLRTRWHQAAHDTNAQLLLKMADHNDLQEHHQENQG